MTQVVLLDKSPSSSSTCTTYVDDSCNAAAPSGYQGTVFLTEAEVSDREEMLDIPCTTEPTAYVPSHDEHRNVASQVSHSTANLLYDGDETTPLIRPSRRPRPWQPRRSVSLPLPPRLTIPHTVLNERPPLSRGPSGYHYAPLSSRSIGYESLRDDHGIRFKKRFSFAAMALHWHLLVDEDAAPNRLRERVVKSAGRKRDKVKNWFKDLLRKR